jgi:hypothetical protein
MASGTHESSSRYEAAIPGSERSFGIVMTAVFAYRCSTGGMPAIPGLDRRNRSLFPCGGDALSGRIKAAQFVLVQVRPTFSIPVGILDLPGFYKREAMRWLLDGVSADYCLPLRT